MNISKCFWGVLVIPMLLGVSSVYSATVEVTVSSWSFSPPTVNINQGDSIRWTSDSSLHTTTSGSSCTPSGIWDYAFSGFGDTFIRQFTTVDTFPYFCIPHCGINMTGTVIVQGVGVEEDSQTGTPSSKFEILQNRPNPFRGSTNIRYSLAERSPVKIEVFDLVGRRVRTLVNSHQQAGQKQVEWNGEDDLGQPLNTGIYFIRYETPNFKSVQKLIHLR